MSTTNHNALPEEIAALLADDQKEGLSVLLSHLLASFRTIGTTLRAGGFSSSTIGTQNQFGDEQLDVDVKTDSIIFTSLRAAGNVHVAASEENPVEIKCGYSGGSNSEGYSVAFDPLDGSSIVDCNFAVGTIVGVWPGAGLLNRSGSEQCAALMAQYGPKVTVALALNSNSTLDSKQIALELTMLPESWKVSVPSIRIKATAKTFAPGICAVYVHSLTLSLSHVRALSLSICLCVCVHIPFLWNYSWIKPYNISKCSCS